MILTAKSVLLNLLVVFAPLSIIQVFYLLQHTNFLKRSSKWILTIFPGISIVFCMMYPFVFNDEFILDFRRIPFILGGLYGGHWVAFGYLIVTLGFRYSIGGSGFITTLIFFGGLAIIISFLSPMFKKLDLKHKLLLALALDSVVGWFSAGFSLAFYDTGLPTNVWVVFNITSSIGIIVAILVYEVFISQFNLLNSVMEGQKLKVASHLAASISHEVRNPLTVSRGFLQLIDSDVKDPKTKGYMDLAIKEIDRATDIINDYLTFAKPYPEKYDVIEIERELYTSLNVIQPLATMNDVTITSHIELPSTIIEYEKKKFQQCIMNILKNSIEAMPEGGTLTVEATKKGSKVIITISDTGVGMTPEQLSRIGEPFFTTKEKGTGLGMMVTHSIISAMNGHLSFESKPGKGTTVTIFLEVKESSTTGFAEQSKKGIS
ncbi:ATP-binding protein [Alkalihalobacillus sp. CinArs1]|uniref:ATP-binding protein n=1 Tax=Alkalihalobacillus sp. CinArs1 TaxID=2995314 RepID=UPI0022DD09CC|nr:ATP-binding protein [Alkalihalobacillus sp. CinArs1]